jgi:hypothetical protein
VGVKKTKAKLSSAGGKLLASIKAEQKKAEAKKLAAQMAALPMVDVPVTSTPVKTGPPKKLGIMWPSGKPVDPLPEGMSPSAVLKKWAEDVAAHQDASEPTDPPTDAGLKQVQEFLDKLKQASNVIYANTKGFELETVGGVKLVDIAGVPTITGKAKLLDPIHSSEELAQAEFQDWMDSVVAHILDYLKGEPLDAVDFQQARTSIEDIYHGDTHLGNAPPFFQTLPKETVICRTGLRLLFALEDIHGTITPAQRKAFVHFFPVLDLPMPVSKGTINTMVGITAWMGYVAEIVYDFVHWQPVEKETLLLIRKYIEEAYDQDLLPRLPITYDASLLPKEGVVYRTASRVRHMCIKKGGWSPEEVNPLFQEVFPLPDSSVLAPVMLAGPLPGQPDLQTPYFAHSAEDVEAILGTPNESSELNHLTAILLQKTKEYMKAHPEAAAYVGPLDLSAPPFVAPPPGVPNKNKRVYPKKIWDEAVKKLQPKFSKEAEADAKAPCVVQFIPTTPAEYIELDLVIDKATNKPFIETTVDGKVIAKEPVSGLKLSPKALATLKRFGVILKGDS